MEKQMTDANTHYRRAHEQAEVDADKRNARKSELAKMRFDQLRNSHHDFAEAMREMMWRETPDHIAMHQHYRANRANEFGLYVAKLVDDYLMDQAEEWADVQVDKG
jgi:hypothetical protein